MSENNQIIVPASLGGRGVCFLRQLYVAALLRGGVRYYEGRAALGSGGARGAAAEPWAAPAEGSSGEPGARRQGRNDFGMISE